MRGITALTPTRVAWRDMAVVKNLVQENEETEGKGNEEDGEKSQDGEERQKHLEVFTKHCLVSSLM